MCLGGRMDVCRCMHMCVKGHDQKIDLKKDYWLDIPFPSEGIMTVNGGWRITAVSTPVALVSYARANK